MFDHAAEVRNAEGVADAEQVRIEVSLSKVSL